MGRKKVGRDECCGRKEGGGGKVKVDMSFMCYLMLLIE